MKIFLKKPKAENHYKRKNHNVFIALPMERCGFGGAVMHGHHLQNTEVLSLFHMLFGFSLLCP